MNEYADGPQNPEFACFMCGMCCSRYQVRLSLLEARQICERLDMSWKDFLDRCTDPRWPGESSLLLVQKNGGCVFLKRSFGEKTALCRIHEFKPSSCREWTAGPFRRECREGLEKYWGLGVDSEGNVTGEPGKLERFHHFSANTTGPVEAGE